MEEAFKEHRNKILPIDRPGWGWIVVLAAAGLFALQSGSFTCTGVILVEMIEEYEGVYSPSTLLWVFTIKWILSGFLGPLTSLLIVKTTHRSVALLGVTLVTISYIGLAYSETMYTMIAFHSIIGGFGGGMIIIPAMLVSAQYFDKQRASALGITACGSGVGTLTLPYIIRYLYDNYDYKGATLLYGGFALNFAILASLLRPISYYEQIHSKELKKCEEEFQVLSEGKRSDIKLDSDYIESTDDSGFRRVRSVSLSNPVGKDSERLIFVSQTTVDKNQWQLENNHLLVPSSTHETKSASSMLSVGNLSGSVYFENKEGEEKTVVSRKKDREQMNLKVLLMPKFLTLAISIFIYTLGTTVVYGLLPSLGKECGIPKDTIALMMLLSGVIEMPCRIISGVIADRHYMAAFHQLIICIFGTGLMEMLCAAISGLPGIALMLIGLSTMGTSIFSLIPPALRELIGEQNVTSGMGFQMIFQAFGFIGSSFIAGQIYDHTGSWINVYYYVAGTAILSSIIAWPLIIYNKCKTTGSIAEAKRADNSQLKA